MMYRLLIVDDEIVIREGLKSIIDWEKYGFAICGEGENGRDGLEKIDRLKPDLVIADLKMPGIDGLEMIETLRKNGNKCRVIILTGYPEFDYAQKAVELGAEAYLLKPLEEDELIEKITAVYLKISEDEGNRDAYIEIVGVARAGFMQELVSGRIDDDLVLRLNQLYALELPWNSYQIVLIDIPGSLVFVKETQHAIRTILDAFLSEGKRGLSFVINGNLGILVKNQCFDANNLSPLRNLGRKIKDCLGPDIVISVGKGVDDLQDIFKSYENAAALLQKKFVLCVDNLIMDRTVTTPVPHGTDVFANTENLADKIHMAVETHQTAYINDLLEEIKNKVLAEELDEHAIKLGYVDICSRLVSKLMKNKVEPTKPAGEIGRFAAEIMKKPDLQSLHGYAKFLLYHIADEITTGSTASTMESIIRYIDQNFGSDLKLSTISEVFGYENTYLGRLFKKVVGCNFNNYLDKVRIENAKKFLRDGDKIYEVAQKVGYNDKDYFYSKFRKYEKMAPMEYKKSTSVKSPPDIDDSM